MGESIDSSRAEKSEPATDCVDFTRPELPVHSPSFKSVAALARRNHCKRLLIQSAPNAITLLQPSLLIVDISENRLQSDCIKTYNRVE